MSSRPEFAVSVDQNPHLAVGGREMHAIITVEATGAVSAATGAAQVIILDSSGSMSSADKMPAARRAAAAAIRGLRDGVRFAVIAGANRPRMVYPRERALAEVNDRTRGDAERAVARVEAAGGTAIGSWLRLAAALLESPGPEGMVRHAMLLTDGKNQHETADELDAALAACADRFVCDARGVGTDWDVAELRKITSALLGSFLDVPDPAGLEAAFREMTGAAMGKRVADVTLRVWLARNAEVRFLKQMVPSVDDLTGRATGAGDQLADYPTGAWGDETREYHLCVAVPPAEPDRRMRAAWVRMAAPGLPEDAGGFGSVLVQWTGDEEKATRINGRVAHHTGQSELAQAVAEGLAARREGDEDRATARLGRAVALAKDVGNEQVAELLDRVVDVIDPVSGTVRLRPGVGKADEMALETRSVRTVRTVRTGGRPHGPDGG